jgi:hypothetical protein
MRRSFTNFVKNGNRVGENRKQVRVSVVRKIENTPEGLSPGETEQINNIIVVKCPQFTAIHATAIRFKQI